MSSLKSLHMCDITQHPTLSLWSLHSIFGKIEREKLCDFFSYFKISLLLTFWILKSRFVSPVMTWKFDYWHSSCESLNNLKTLSNILFNFSTSSQFLSFSLSTIDYFLSDIRHMFKSRSIMLNTSRIDGILLKGWKFFLSLVDNSVKCVYFPENKRKWLKGTRNDQMRENLSKNSSYSMNVDKHHEVAIKLKEI